MTSLIRRGWARWSHSSLRLGHQRPHRALPYVETPHCEKAQVTVAHDTCLGFQPGCLGTPAATHGALIPAEAPIWWDSVQPLPTHSIKEGRKQGFHSSALGAVLPCPGGRETCALHRPSSLSCLLCSPLSPLLSLFFLFGRHRTRFSLLLSNPPRHTLFCHLQLLASRTAPRTPRPHTPWPHTPLALPRAWAWSELPAPGMRGCSSSRVRS